MKPGHCSSRLLPTRLPASMVWMGFGAALIAAPLLSGEGAGLSLLSQIGMVMIFGLSYNMLLGQGGMLSFGHAVYAGLGAYCIAHALNMAGAGKLPIPVSLMPLLGGAAGMTFGVLFGYVTTKRAGTTFAMITLGLMELVFASTLLWPEFFGGEGGVSTNRVIGSPVLGIDYASGIAVYYLIAFWLFVSTAAMYAFTCTPLGRILNAVRDNPERAQSIGYDPQRVRYLTLILSAGFAGISGALSAIYFESVSAESVGAARSGAILLFTVIGGAGFFIGPMVGAVVGVLLTVVLSDVTRAWHLYVGVFFMLIVRYAPGGITGLLVMSLPVLRSGNFRSVLPWCLAMVAALLLMLSATVLMTEMLYRLTLEMHDATALHFLGVTFKANSIASWSLAILMLASGIWVLLAVRPRFLHAWHTVQQNPQPALQHDSLQSIQQDGLPATQSTLPGDRTLL